MNTFTYRADALMPPSPYEWAEQFLKHNGPDVDPREVYRQAYQQVASQTYAMQAREGYQAGAYEAKTGQPF